MPEDIRQAISEFVSEVGIDDNFEYDADVIFLHYKKDKIVGIMAFDLLPMQGVPTPVVTHIIGDKSFRRTKEAVNFMLDTFRYFKEDYTSICVELNTSKTFLIRQMVALGFAKYYETMHCDFYYLDLGLL